VRAEWTIPPLWCWETQDLQPVWLHRHWLSLSRWQDRMSYVCSLTELSRDIRQQLWILTLHIILVWQKCCARHNCWQNTRCSWPRNRQKATRCQLLTEKMFIFSVNSGRRSWLKPWRASRWQSVNQWKSTTTATSSEDSGLTEQIHASPARIAWLESSLD